MLHRAQAGRDPFALGRLHPVDERDELVHLPVAPDVDHGTRYVRAFDPSRGPRPHRGTYRGALLRNSLIESSEPLEDLVGVLREVPVSYTHLRAHETPEHLVCRLLL